jgi:hypothetical protein
MAHHVRVVGQAYVLALVLHALFVLELGRRRAVVRDECAPDVDSNIARSRYGFVYREAVDL